LFNAEKKRRRKRKEKKKEKEKETKRSSEGDCVFRAFLVLMCGESCHFTASFVSWSNVFESLI